MHATAPVSFGGSKWRGRGARVVSGWVGTFKHRLHVRTGAAKHHKMVCLGMTFPGVQRPLFDAAGCMRNADVHGVGRGGAGQATETESQVTGNRWIVQQGSSPVLRPGRAARHDSRRVAIANWPSVFGEHPGQYC